MKVLTDMAHLQYHHRYAMLTISCKFGESKWNPNRLIAIMSSTGTNYVLNEHEDLDPIWLICNTIRYNATPNLSWKFGESKLNPYWVIMLGSSSGTNYVLNEHEDFDIYGSFKAPSKTMSYQSPVDRHRWCQQPFSWRGQGLITDVITYPSWY